MLKMLKFLFVKSRLKKRIEQVLQGSLTESSKIKISYFRKRITITDYGSGFISKIDSFVTFLNSAFSSDYFPISDYKIDMFKIEFVADKVPLAAKIPKNFDLKKLDIILGVDEHKKVITMNCHLNNVLLATLPSGSGKTFSLLNILKKLEVMDYNGYERVICVDVKQDGSFDHLESERFIIFRNQEHLAEFLEKESIEIMSNGFNRPQLFIFDEIFLWSDARLYSSKQDKIIATKINNFIELGIRAMRSKKQVFFLLTQSPNSLDLPISIAIITLKLMGYVRLEIGRSLGLKTQNLLRSDFKFGRFLLVQGADEKIIRMVE